MFINQTPYRHLGVLVFVAFSVIATGCASRGEQRDTQSAPSTPAPIVEPAPASPPVVAPAAPNRTISSEPRVIATTPAPARPSTPTEGTMPILEAQRRLAELGLQPGPIDGSMGPRTAAALRQFQRNERIPQTGVLDAATSARLRTARR